MKVRVRRNGPLAPPQLLHTVGVAQGVEGVLARARGRGDVGNHDGAAVPLERVPQHLGELAAAEGHVARLGVQRTNALLQRQEGLVDLRPLHARLAVVVRRVRAALAPREVDEGELAPEAALERLRLVAQVARGNLLGAAARARGLLEHQLQDGVRAGRVAVGARAARAARRRPQLNQLLHLLQAEHLVLLQSHDAHVLAAVLAHRQLLAALQQIEDFASVDFKEAQPQVQVFVLRLLELLNKVAAGADGQGVHGVRFAAPRLPVRKARRLRLAEYGVQ
mmetsp:Transcript_37025/g.70994  ORF Transcript_37025/g.70994 Transcript_37025/m.70994 type:complete len:279 (-) Transcript_37025:1193-2029(-)